jgi:SAM-dependent methyltransferase
VHLQCHIGTDTLSLARRGAARVVGLDFSAQSLAAARRLAEQTAGGEKLGFVEASVYDAAQVLAPGSFDLVFTGIGALCWLPDIRRWARTVAALLKPNGRLFIREDHPMSMAIADNVTDALVVENTYFERKDPLVWNADVTYVPVEDGTVFTANVTHQWNHGLGEIVQAVLDAGMRITGLKEHKSVPWPAIDGRMRELDNGMWFPYVISWGMRPTRLMLDRGMGITGGPR